MSGVYGRQVLVQYAGLERQNLNSKTALLHVTFQKYKIKRSLEPGIQNTRKLEKTMALGSKGVTQQRTHISDGSWHMETIETWQVMRTRKKSGRNKLGDTGRTTKHSYAYLTDKRSKYMET